MVDYSEVAIGSNVRFCKVCTARAVRCPDCGDDFCEEHQEHECGEARELSDAFYPGTIGGLADEWWKAIKDRREAEDRVNRYAAILLARSVMEHNGADEPYRQGLRIDGREVKVRAVWRLTEGTPTPKWKPQLVRCLCDE